VDNYSDVHFQKLCVNISILFQIQRRKAQWPPKSAPVHLYTISLQQTSIDTVPVICRPILAHLQIFDCFEDNAQSSTTVTTATKLCCALKSLWPATNHVS